MEQQQEDFEQAATNPQLIVTEEMRSYIYDTAKWASFLGVLGIIIAAFMLMAALTVAPALNANPALAKMLGQLGTINGATLSIVFVIYGLMFLYPSLLMVRYAAKAKQGVLYGEQDSLDNAMDKLKSLFKFFGVLAIILIGLNLITAFSSLLIK